MFGEPFLRKLLAETWPTGQQWTAHDSGFGRPSSRKAGYSSQRTQQALAVPGFRAGSRVMEMFELSRDWGMPRSRAAAVSVHMG